MAQSERMLCTALRAKLMSAPQAASLVANGANVGMSGFTGSGYPKLVPRELAARSRLARTQGDTFRIGVWTGASTGPELDGAIAEAGGMHSRLPYQSDPACRAAINAGEIDYTDSHLSNVAGYARTGCLGKLHTALVEVTKVLEDGRLVPSTSVGNSQTWLDLADEVILEVNSRQSEKLEGVHDIAGAEFSLFGSRPVPIARCDDRIGTPYFTCDLDKIVAVVETDVEDRNSPFPHPDENAERIARHIIEFLEREVKRGCIPKDLLPLQTGVGNVANAVLAGFRDSRFGGLCAYTEVIQDSMLDLLRSGRMRCASATAFSLSPSAASALDSTLDEIRDRIVLRPQEISNHPEVIRRLGCIAINTMIEADIYGNVNSTCIMGSRIQNGIGGSGDFARNAFLSFFVSPSRALSGAVSRIVPMAPHVDHTDHDVKVIVTEQGLADIRGLSPRKRAKKIIETCAHPDFRPALRDYYSYALATSHGKQVPHALDRAFELHNRFLRSGHMLERA